jgi:chitinase
VKRDLGSVNAPPPLDHRDSGVGWSRKDIMDRQKILIEHWRWLEANGYKQQAASCKRQALDLTRKNYNVIGVYRRKKYDDKIYESKRSIKNN